MMNEFRQLFVGMQDLLQLWNAIDLKAVRMIAIAPMPLI
jgi:hypothetical protein